MFLNKIKILSLLVLGMASLSTLLNALPPEWDDEEHEKYRNVTMNFQPHSSRKGYEQLIIGEANSEGTVDGLNEYHNRQRVYFSEINNKFMPGILSNNPDDQFTLILHHRLQQNEQELNRTNDILSKKLSSIPYTFSLKEEPKSGRSMHRYKKTCAEFYEARENFHKVCGDILKFFNAYKWYLEKVTPEAKSAAQFVRETEVELEVAKDLWKTKFIAVVRTGQGQTIRKNITAKKRGDPEPTLHNILLQTKKNGIAIPKLAKKYWQLAEGNKVSFPIYCELETL